MTIPTGIPTLDDLAADPISHHYDDMIAPSGLTNFLGTVRVDHDLTTLSVVQFPPVSQGLSQTGSLYIDGRLFESLGVPVTHEWRPDRVRRTATFDGLRVETTTACVPGSPAVVIDISVANLGTQPRTVDIGMSLAAHVTRSKESWNDAVSPSEANVATVDAGTLVFHSADERAWSIQGLDVTSDVTLSGVASPTDSFEDAGIGGNGRGGQVEARLAIPEGGCRRLGYVQALGSSLGAARDVYSAAVADVRGMIAQAESFWTDQLVAAFTPGNSEYSGHLPRLETSSGALRRIYWWAVFGVIWFRRDFAGNVLGRTFDTLMPNYWGTSTFIWDYSLSSLSHALLDPVEMKRQISQWISLDIHSHFGTSSLTGRPIGRWYSVNDYAMTRLVNDYVRVSGDRAFLGQALGDQPSVLAAVCSWSRAWEGLRRDGSGLADYGEIDNLLECVSSYTHEVASLNAANVWNLRAAADLCDLVGEEAAEGLREEADALVPAVLDLYVPGAGFFAAGQPDGTSVPVRHCYDFSVVGTALPNDLSTTMREEMVEFFRRELQTENWMRALSPWDPDASYSVRPDHQWNGAYPAWPADAGRALVAIGASDVLLDWLEGLSRTANQGPMGQAHFVDEAEPSINGGARKAPPQFPYITDWACSSSGAWVELVISALFGVTVGTDGSITAGGPIADLDPGAVLRGLLVAGREFDVYANGKVTEAQD